jgi:RNA polymerase subunit RPABC4/transcription elongation factor Spt4
VALCTHCGKPLSEGVLACPFCNKLVEHPLTGATPPRSPERTVECGRCHRLFSADERSCPHCGEDRAGLMAGAEIAEELIAEEAETGCRLRSANIKFVYDGDSNYLSCESQPLQISVT